MRRLARISLTLAALALIFSTPVSVASTPEECLAAHIRAERKAAGVRALTWDSRLAGWSEQHAEKMSNAETIFHSRTTAPPGYSGWGENVGMASDCDLLHAAFMASPGHRENILDPDWRVFGIGVRERDGILFAVEQFAIPKVTIEPKPSKKAKPKMPRVEPSCGS